MSLPAQPTPEWHAKRVLAELRLQTGNRMDWAALPIQLIALDRIVFPCHDLDPDHVHGVDVEVTTGPIHVEQLLDGAYFVHDGRHRTLRARTNGHNRIWARVYERPTIPARIHA